MTSTAKCSKCKDTGSTNWRFYDARNLNCECPAGRELEAWYRCSDEQNEASRIRNVEVVQAARKAERHARRDARRAEAAAR